MDRSIKAWVLGKELSKAEGSGERGDKGGGGIRPFSDFPSPSTGLRGRPNGLPWKGYTCLHGVCRCFQWALFIKFHNDLLPTHGADVGLSQTLVGIPLTSCRTIGGQAQSTQHSVNTGKPHHSLKTERLYCFSGGLELETLFSHKNNAIVGRGFPGKPHWTPKHIANYNHLTSPLRNPLRGTILSRAIVQNDMASF